MNKAASDGSSETFTGQYDELGRILPEEADMTYEYDQQGRVTKITYEDEGTDQSYAEFTYDAQGRFVRQDQYNVHNGETYHNYTIYTYND